VLLALAVAKPGASETAFLWLAQFWNR